MKVDVEIMGVVNYVELWVVVYDLEVVWVMLEDYCVGFIVDCEYEEVDWSVGCWIDVLMFIFWFVYDDFELLYGDLFEIWWGWVMDVRGYCVDSCYYMVEEVVFDVVVLFGWFFF